MQATIASQQIVHHTKSLPSPTNAGNNPRWRSGGNAGWVQVKTSFSSFAWKDLSKSIYFFLEMAEILDIPYIMVDIRTWIFWSEGWRNCKTGASGILMALIRSLRSHGYMYGYTLLSPFSMLRMQFIREDSQYIVVGIKTWIFWSEGWGKLLPEF